MSKFCNFCGKEIKDTEISVSGNNGCICADCAKLMQRILDENREEVEKKDLTALPKPHDIKKFLDDYVIGQDGAKIKVAVAVYNHYKRVWGQNVGDDIDIQKSNIILCAKTGTGKTEIARTVAKMLNVAFVVADCTSLTQSGYVGDDVETILTSLLQAADYDVEKAEQGIVFLDEIDKLGRKGGNASITRDVSGEGVQQGLLKIIEGTYVNVPPQGGRKHPDAKMIKVNTKNILFIGAGAFEGIEQRIAQRMNVHSIGYTDETKKIPGKQYDKEHPLHNILPDDLVKFGLIPELVGRMPVIATLDELDKAALRKILTEPKNALVKQYQKLFAMDGITLTFEEKAYDYIVDKAVEYKLGARGLRGIMEEIMTQIMYDAPSGDKKTIKVTLKQAQKIYGE